MKSSGVSGRSICACLATLICMTPAAVLAQSENPKLDARMSPVAMSANSPGLDITPRYFDRLVTQTELTPKQLETLGVRPGKLEEKDLADVFMAADDSRIRNFIDFFDQGLAKTQDRTQTKNWKVISTFEPFIDDAVNFGGFDGLRENEFRKSLRQAGDESDSPEALQGRITAFRFLSEARQGAVKTARGYRQLVELLKRELEGRELVRNIGLVVELRTPSKQPTLSPLSIVTMQCGTSPGAQKLVFTQRKRTCNESGVCRVESIAEISKGSEYRTLFDKLQKDGRSYLDGCSIGLTMLVDGAEITRQLPGKFTSHIAPASP